MVPELDTPVTLTAVTRAQLLTLILDPIPAGDARLRVHFFAALSYIMDPLAFHTHLWAAMGGPQSEQHMMVLAYWLQEHFHFFQASPALMNALMQQLASPTLNKTRAQLCNGIVEAQTKLVVRPDGKRTPLDVRYLKTVLVAQMERGTPPETLDTVLIAHEHAVDALTRDPTLRLSIADADEDTLRFRINKLASDAVRRLVVGGFLLPTIGAAAPDDDQQQQQQLKRGRPSPKGAVAPTPSHYALSSIAVAYVHLLQAERGAQLELQALRDVLNLLARNVQLTTHTDAAGQAVPLSMTGREMVQWLCSPDAADCVPAVLRAADGTITDAVAMEIGTKLLRAELIMDTSSSFAIFSATHYYALPLSIHLTASDGSLNGSMTDSAEDPFPDGTSAAPAERFDSLSGVAVGDIARALTALDVELLQQINLVELDHQGWKKSDSPTCTVQEWIAHFNRVCFLVSTELITCPWPDERKALLEKWIDVAAALRDAGNFHSMFAVVGGLTLNPTQRLSDLWARVDSKRQALFSSLVSATSSSHNFKEYRAMLAAASATLPNVIPYAGLLLQDILSIEELPLLAPGADANDPNPLLNWERLRKFAATKMRLKAARDRCEAPAALEAVVRYVVSGGVVLDCDTLYALSLKIQPRGATAQPRRSGRR